jgi:7-cyano-7-deazaguanine reductase
MHKNLPLFELGKKSAYESTYNPKKLFPIARNIKRAEILIPPKLPFTGYDIWNHYELSWLNSKGKPQLALAQIIYSCDSPNIIESKSMKLYFNTLNNTKFASAEHVINTVSKDLSEAVKDTVHVVFFSINKNQSILFSELDGILLDNLDVSFDNYEINKDFLSTGDEIVTETICSNLLKSNCLITSQPDWGSIQIKYTGLKINHEGLLKYIVSFRNHNEFHEQCIERIFMDITNACKPQDLLVYGRYTRRGGLDINPIRSSYALTEIAGLNKRTLRQ